MNKSEEPIALERQLAESAEMDNRILMVKKNEDWASGGLKNWVGLTVENDGSAELSIYRSTVAISGIAFRQESLISLRNHLNGLDLG